MIHTYTHAKAIFIILEYIISIYKVVKIVG